MAETIYVNTDNLLSRAQEMEDILADIADRESETIRIVGDLGNDWEGQDYTLFLAHYASTVTDSSVYVQVYQIIVNYLNYLRTAAYYYDEVIQAAEEEARAIGGGSFNARAAEAQNVLTGVLKALNVKS